MSSQAQFTRSWKETKTIIKSDTTLTIYDNGDTQGFLIQYPNQPSQLTLYKMEERRKGYESGVILPEWMIPLHVFSVETYPLIVRGSSKQRTLTIPGWEITEIIRQEQEQQQQEKEQVKEQQQELQQQQVQQQQQHQKKQQYQSHPSQHPRPKSAGHPTSPLQHPVLTQQKPSSPQTQPRAPPPKKRVEKSKHSLHLSPSEKNKKPHAPTNSSLPAQD